MLRLLRICWQPVSCVWMKLESTFFSSSLRLLRSSTSWDSVLRSRSRISSNSRANSTSAAWALDAGGGVASVIGTASTCRRRVAGRSSRPAGTAKWADSGWRRATCACKKLALMKALEQCEHWTQQYDNHQHHHHHHQTCSRAGRPTGRAGPKNWLSQMGQARVGQKNQWMELGRAKLTQGYTESPKSTF